MSLLLPTREVVQPIRDEKKIERMKRYLYEHNRRDHAIFVTGINVGLRISDILPLQAGQFRRPHLDIIEAKTGKRKVVKLNEPVRAVMDEYLEGVPDDVYVFQGRSCKLATGAKGLPISTSAAYKGLRKAATRCGIENFGTHSLRKTFGYHMYRKKKNVVLLMDLFNHAHPSITLRYIGITQDTLDDAVDDLNL